MNDDLDEARTLLSAVAMHAMLSHPGAMSTDSKTLAEVAVAKADALLAELKKPK